MVENLTDHPGWAHGSFCRDFNGEQREMDVHIERLLVRPCKVFSSKASLHCGLGWLPASMYNCRYTHSHLSKFNAQLEVSPRHRLTESPFSADDPPTLEVGDGHTDAVIASRLGTGMAIRRHHYVGIKQIASSIDKPTSAQTGLPDMTRRSVS